MSSRRSRPQRKVAKRSAPAEANTTGGSSSKTDSEKITKYISTTSGSKRKQNWLTPPDQTDSSSSDSSVQEVQTMSRSKRQHYEIKNQWTKIADCTQITTRTLVPSEAPAQPTACEAGMLASGASSYTFRNIQISEDCNSRCPLPPLTWADPQEVWRVLREKDRRYVRHHNYKVRHPELEYHMRAILLDWLMEVCEAYHLHRETFFLATDFLDRFLSVQENVKKYQLQLIGVTCLFIAAKIEEIYPPKIGEFAEITDGACTELDIVKQEMVILMRLRWNLSPFSINLWVCAYLTILNHSAHEKENTLTKINYSRHSFIQIARLMDLAVLDEGCLRYSYGVIAAAILYHFSDETTTFQASGYLFSDIEDCVSWLAPLALTIREANLPVALKHFTNVLPDDLQNIQTHDVTLALLNQAKQRQQEMVKTVSRASPEPTAYIADVLTPPPTKHKHSAAAEGADLTSEPSTADVSFQSSLNTLHI